MKEKISLSIRKIKLDNIAYDDMTPMEILSLAADVERKMEQISAERNIIDVYKLALYTALDYAAAAAVRQSAGGSKTKEENRHLDEAILKLNNCLERLPLE